VQRIDPDTFAHDEARMARFSREAQLSASLNHPNIAAIYGVEDSGEQSALALELVEGETLAEKIARGQVARFHQMAALKPDGGRTAKNSFTFSPDGKLIAAPISLSPNGQSVEVGTLQELFAARLSLGPPSRTATPAICRHCGWPSLSVERPDKCSERQSHHDDLELAATAIALATTGGLRK
jgi:hypothetical protein